MRTSSATAAATPLAPPPLPPPHLLQLSGPRLQLVLVVGGKEKRVFDGLHFKNVTVVGRRQVDDVLDVAAEETVEGLLGGRRMEPLDHAAAGAVNRRQPHLHPRVEAQSEAEHALFGDVHVDFGGARKRILRSLGGRRR